MAVSIMEYEKLEDAIRLRPPSQKIAPDYSPEETVYIYLIPGNPGLIEYYRDFLTALSTHPWFNRDDIRFDILGQSLSGFEVHSSHHSRDPSPPYTLQEQVSHLQTRLDYHLSSKQGTKPVRVILVGHSVGAYILLETIARQQEAQRAASSKGSYRAYEIIGGICLFPTIVHLAKSPRGRIAAPIAKLPGFSFLVHSVVYALSIFIPQWLWYDLVQRVTKMPERAARVTTAFLRSRRGVRQAVYMAQYELLEMTHDKWEDDVWGSHSQDPTAVESDATSAVQIDKPKMYFYWGEKDYWVDKEIRDALIVSRAQQFGSAPDEGKPYMEIDTKGIPHDFCIRHSAPVAEKVTEYIEEIVSSRCR